MQRAIPPDPPELPPELDPLSLEPDAAADGESWEGVVVSGSELAGIDARSLGLIEARLDAVDLGGASLTGLFLNDCLLERCNLSNARVRAGSMRRVAVAGARLTGFQWLDGELRDAAFRECRGDMASFEGSKFEHVLFEGCDLRDADFRRCRFESAVFRGCDMTGADIGLARFERCEMAGCVLDGLRGVDRLRGVAMPWADILAAAPVFAGEIGVRVLEE